MTMCARTPDGSDWAVPMSIVTDPATLTEQKIRDEFDLWLGAWAFDITQGMPWLQQILGRKNISKAATNSLFRRALLLTPRVISVLFINVVGPDENRNFALNYSAKVDTGAIVSGSVPLVFNPASATGG